PRPSSTLFPYTTLFRSQEAAQGPRAGEGLLGAQALDLPAREGAGRALARLRLSRPEGPQARFPPALDHADQRRRTAERPLVQPRSEEHTSELQSLAYLV